jgi:hypothetical protein
MARGAGAHAELIFKKVFGSNPGEGCGGCRSLLERMDKNGTAWCRANIKTIVPQIRKNAKKFPHWGARVAAHIPGISKPIYALVILAIRNAEAEEAAEKEKLRTQHEA